MSAVSALGLNDVAVARVIADFVEPLAAHGLRLIAQIKLAADVMIAAIPKSIAGIVRPTGQLVASADAAQIQSTATQSFSAASTPHQK